MRTVAAWIFVGCALLVQPVPSRAQRADGAGRAKFPAKEWPKAQPASLGLDEKALAALDADLASGKYPLVDSFEVIRCGSEVYERKYHHDYGKIYEKEAKTRGPLNARLRGPYNYFDPAWHPYYHGTDLHSMQSFTKTVTSVIFGIAITRGDFKRSLDVPVLHYFDVAKVKNVDDRKRRMTLRNVLTMTTGLDWNEEVPYNDPRSDSSLMEATDDWIGYVMDKPMAAEPGKVFNYSSGNGELLAYIFQKETGQDIEAYGEKYLFRPLGIKHFWKRTPLGVVDTEGGLYLRDADLAKIGYLCLHNGLWNGRRIVSEKWVKQSLTPFIDATGEDGYKYGFLWWLLPEANTDPQRYVWMAWGFGGQRLMVFPGQDLIVVFTGWNILGTPVEAQELVSRILPAVRAHSCAGISTLPAGTLPTQEPFQEILGPFLVTARQGYTVVLHGLRLKWPESAHHKFDIDSDQTMQSFEIKDANGQVVYRETLNDKAETWSLSIGASMVAGKTDRAILLHWESLPSAPDSCSMYQFFGLVNGKFQPLGDAFCDTLEFAGDQSPLSGAHVIKLKEDPETHIEYFNSLHWTGNVHLVIPWRINFIVGKILPTLWTVRKRGHEPPLCEVGVRADRVPQSGMTFIRLSGEPEWSPQHVIVKHDSKVEFLSAALPCHPGQYGLPRLDLSEASLQHDLWLRVRVDGREGWIHEEEDFEAIGLPAAG